MCAIWPNPARPSRGKPGGPVEISCGKNVAGILIFFPAIFSNIFRTFMHFSQHVCNSSGEQTQLLVVLAVAAVVFVVVIIVYGPGAGSVAVSAAAAAATLFLFKCQSHAVQFVMSKSTTDSAWQCRRVILVLCKLRHKCEVYLDWT